MRGEEAAAAGSLGVEEPRQRLLHHLRRVAGALEQLGAVRVRLILLVPAVRARDQRARDRCDRARAREDLVEDHRADGEPRLQTLRLRHMTQVVVRHLMGEHAGQLLIIGLAQEPRGHDVLPFAGAARVDVIVGHDADLDLIEGPLVVSRLDERHHHPLEPLGLGGIDLRGGRRRLRGRGRATATAGGRRRARDGRRAGGAERERGDECRERSQCLHGVHPLTLTDRLLTTAFTPRTLAAIVPARCFSSSLSTTPFRYTVRSVVLTSTLVRVEIFSVASLDLTSAVMVASSIFSPVVLPTALVLDEQAEIMNAASRTRDRALRCPTAMRMAVSPESPR